MTSFYWHLPLLQCANFSLYVKIMPANIASPSMHSNPNVWLPYLRIVTFKKVNDRIIFYIDGRMIDLVQSFSHLGHLITSDSNDGEDITIRKRSYIGQVNNTLCFFANISFFVKYNLFHAYCTSYYGCELWSLSNSNDIESFVLLGGRA